MDRWRRWEMDSSSRSPASGEDHLFIVGGGVNDFDVGQTGTLPGIRDSVVDRLGAGARNDPQWTIVHGGGGAGQHTPTWGNGVMRK